MELTLNTSEPESIADSGELIAEHEYVLIVTWTLEVMRKQIFLTVFCRRTSRNRQWCR